MAVPELVHLVGGPNTFPGSTLQSAMAGTEGLATSTTWEFVDGQHRVVFKGSFEVNGGVVQKGTVTGFDVYDGVVKVMTGTGYSLSETQILNAADGAKEHTSSGYLKYYGTFYGDVREVGSNDSDHMYGSTHSGKFLGKGGDDFLYGGPGAEVMRGGSGNDWVEGRGKADKLFGNSGDDTFAFTSAQGYGPDGVDRIKDFSVKHDTIFLDAGLFDALAAGPLAKAAFHVGGKAKTADQHVLYKASTGGLFYDDDGNGAAKKVQIAELDPGLKLKAHHFDVDFVA
jgi:Ca2+-binding RTX toxin-like protein